jgi:quercetin dioxygenase-like cupin family protein
MSERSNEPTPQRPEGRRILDAPMVTIDLETLVKQIKEEEAWKEKDRNALTVYNTNGMSVVIMALHKGAELKRHQAQGIITVQVLEGKMKFITDEETVERRKGQMLTLHEKIPHGVLALEETVFLLTHAKPLT